MLLTKVFLPGQGSGLLLLLSSPRYYFLCPSAAVAYIQTLGPWSRILFPLQEESVDMVLLYLRTLSYR